MQMLSLPDFETLRGRLERGNFDQVLRRYSDILLAVLVIGVVAIMIVPLPPFLLDLFLAANITLAVSILMLSLYIPNALSLATFPSILLITTLFRLALNVSSTRLILLRAEAGSVISSFGQFVVQGDYIVGFVIFLIITLIQFIVIAKGAERVSEVSARFTLDALPGKQMSIDADLRGGLIDVEEARRRREYLGRESQFYGAMDGAMKFVKGDAIAGILISIINVAAGLTIGVGVRGYDWATAARKFTLLTIGDGLVSQIPSLIIATAAGIITTRVASTVGEEGSLGQEIGSQVLAQPKAIAIAAGMLAGLAVIPGLPFVPFMALAGVAGGMSLSLTRTRERKQKEGLKAELMETAPQASVLGDGRSESPKLPVSLPVILETSSQLTPLVDTDEGGARFVEELLPQMREWIFQDLGAHVPGVKIRCDAPYVEPHSYVIHINEVPAASAIVYPDRVLATSDLDAISRSGVEGFPGVHPDGEGKGIWVPKEVGEKMDRGPGTVIQPDEYMAIHLANTLRRQVAELLGIQDVQNTLDLMEEQGYETLVRSVVPKMVTVQRLSDVLRRLLREDISIKNMRAILEALAEWGAVENDPVYLTEYVRMNLKQYIAYKAGGGEGNLTVWVLDPEIERRVQEGIQASASGSSLSLPPNESRAILESFKRVLRTSQHEGRRPLILTQMEVRYFVRKLIENAFPQVMVLSYQELPSEMEIRPLGRIALVGRQEKAPSTNAAPANARAAR